MSNIKLIELNYFNNFLIDNITKKNFRKLTRYNKINFFKNNSSLNWLYFSIRKIDNNLYFLISFCGRVCLISKCLNIENFKKNLKILFEYKDKEFDNEGNIEAMQTVYEEDGKLYLLCSTASGTGRYGDGHYTFEINIDKLNVIKSTEKKQVDCIRLDTLPAMYKTNDKIYLFTRYNSPPAWKSGKRHLKIYYNDISNNNLFENYNIINFKYYIYCSNPFKIKNINFCFFTCYKKKASNPYNNFFIVLTKTNDFINFEILKENYFPDMNVITGSGIIFYENNYYLPFCKKNEYIFLHKFNYENFI